MTPENFVYWLQGWLEIQNPSAINEQQVQEIKNHIALVLRKETPVLQQAPLYVPTACADGNPGTKISNETAVALKIYKDTKHTIAPCMNFQNVWPFYAKYSEDFQFVTFPMTVNTIEGGTGIVRSLLVKELEECYTVPVNKEMGLKPVFSAVVDSSVVNNSTVTVPNIIYKDNGWFSINENQVREKYVGPFFGWKDPNRYFANFGHYPPASC